MLSRNLEASSSVTCFQNTFIAKVPDKGGDAGAVGGICSPAKDLDEEILKPPANIQSERKVEVDPADSNVEDDGDNEEGKLLLERGWRIRSVDEPDLHGTDDTRDSSDNKVVVEREVSERFTPNEESSIRDAHCECKISASCDAINKGAEGKVGDNIVDDDDDDSCKVHLYSLSPSVWWSTCPR